MCALYGVSLSAGPLPVCDADQFLFLQQGCWTEVLEPGCLPWPRTGLSGCWQQGCGAWALGLRCGGTLCPGRQYLLGVSA